MNKVILLGMVFNETDAPDFGSIRQSESGEYILLADDIPKLNSTLTRSHCAPLLANGSLFNVLSGALAFVADWKTEASGYIWDSTSGEDRPVKENDHLMDSTRYQIQTLRLYEPYEEYRGAFA